MSDSKLKALNDAITGCTFCPRLVEFRRHAPARASYQREAYWRKPVPGFGDPGAWLLLLGLAPSAQGGNRTGRIFTGDESGRFLMKALFSAGLASQPFSERRDDGLRLHGCYITAAVKCVPPKNLPLPQEFINCSPYLHHEIFLLSRLKAVLAFGHRAFSSYLRFLKGKHAIGKAPPFSHRKKLTIDGWPTLYACYHPSPQNTYTQKLTEDDLVSFLDEIICESR